MVGKIKTNKTKRRLQKKILKKSAAIVRDYGENVSRRGSGGGWGLKSPPSERRLLLDGHFIYE